MDQMLFTTDFIDWLNVRFKLTSIVIRLNNHVTLFSSRAHEMAGILETARERYLQSTVCFDVLKVKFSVLLTKWLYSQ